MTDRPKKHATAGLLIFCRDFPDRHWRLGLIDHPRLGWWMIPGGHVEDDETPADAALREGLEESGLQDLKLLPAPAPDLPDGYPHPRVAQPWWITELSCPPDSHLAEPHVHVDHQWVAITANPDPSLPAAHPFRWFTAEEIAELRTPEDTALLAKVLFNSIEEITTAS